MAFGVSGNQIQYQIPDYSAKHEGPRCERTESRLVAELGLDTTWFCFQLIKMYSILSCYVTSQGCLYVS